MARVSRKRPTYVSKLTKALDEGLAHAGIDVDVTAEPIPGTRLYRFYVIGPKLERLKHTERQSLVWRIAEQTLSSEDRLLVSMIMTLSPTELRGAA